MKNKTLFLALLVYTIVGAACKHDKEEPVTPVVYPNYTQLKVGNYWIYERFEVDPFGNATPLNIFDSSYVEKDTLINNQNYFKLFRLDPYFSDTNIIFLLRDSLHYTVDVLGEVVFSSEDFETVFKTYYIPAAVDTIAQVVLKMEEPDFLVTTPAGTFTTLNYRTTFNFNPGWSSHGNPRYMHKRYAEGVGLVLETIPFFANNPNTIERRLVRYQVN